MPLVRFASTCLLLVLVSLPVRAQSPNTGTVTGIVIDESTRRPVPFANVAVHSAADSAIVTGAATDDAGKISIANVPAGAFYLTYGLIGYVAKSSAVFRIDAEHKHLNVGTVSLTPKSVDLDEVLITGEKALFTSSIDRKVYNVDKDLMAKSGSASELLQNIPSVQVDIDGNISLRGSGNVRFMVNGKTSPLLDKNSADALQNMPASSIERIEVITNPSAKYKPDGTSGIINIVQKKNTALGLNGNLSGNAGNQGRYNANVRLNFNPGDWNVYAGYGLRNDKRNRITADARRQTDSASAVTFYRNDLNSSASPLSHTLTAGADYRLGEHDQLGVSGNYFYNSFSRDEQAVQLLQDAGLATLNDYRRIRRDDQFEKEYGFTAYVEHDFPGEEHQLRLEYTLSRSPEQEDNHYTNVYLFPSGPTSFEHTLILAGDDRSQVALSYSDPLSESASLEAGYEGEFSNNDLNNIVETFDPAAEQYLSDASRTNRFLYHEAINAVYATYKESFGAFGLMAGLRTEKAHIRSELLTTNATITNDYVNLYPSLHLSYTLGPALELQLSYSRRTHRPRGEDLNPFQEYRDPRNAQAGNPRLLPEYISSFELGCQLQNDVLTVVPALFYRYTYNRITNVTELLNDTTLFTTKENLSTDRSGGLEIVVSANVGELLTLHWNASGFRNEIDATNLGYAGTRSTTTWTSGLTANVNCAQGSRVQVNSNYNSARLTPQGEFIPSWVVNMGYRQEFMEGRLAMVVTVADIFKTLKRQLELSTPALTQTVTNTRDTRVLFLGFTYQFGVPPKKSKDDQLRYDDSL